MSKEKLIDALVRNIWGSWDELYTATRNLINVVHDNREIGSKQFKNALIGSTQLSSDEYILAIKAIEKSITYVKKKEENKEIYKPEEKKQENSSEKTQKVVTKEMIQDAKYMEQREMKRAGGEQSYNRTMFK
ncbi:MAG: hypothetical protein CR972_03670 [Candidatus Moraniibacteriota bacterium]|nr:MAG: hypothetical protein CR972_03670 [Candidatus Moranbacteria bacterium]